MLRPKSPQSSFYGSYLYDRIIPEDHLLVDTRIFSDCEINVGIILQKL